MANAQPAPPPGLRPMRPIQRVPFVEETLPLIGPPLADPNDHPSASTPPASAAAPAASAPAVASVPSFVTGAASPPSAATALGTVAPALSAAPKVSQYADPLLQTVAYHDPMVDIATRVAGIGVQHPSEDAEVSKTVVEEAGKEDVAMGILEPALKHVGIEQGAAKLGLGGTLEALGVGAAGLVGGVLAGVFMGSKPLNEGEDEAVRKMHESDPAWQEMLRRQKEDPTYSPLHDDPPSSPPPSSDPPPGN